MSEIERLSLEIERLSLEIGSASRANASRSPEWDLVATVIDRLPPSRCANTAIHGPIGYRYAHRSFGHWSRAATVCSKRDATASRGPSP